NRRLVSDWSSDVCSSDLELAYGSLLRRHGHRRAARQQLESARERLLALRAEPTLRRCEAELAGTGLKPIRRTVDARNLLTSQERSEEHTSELQSLTNLVC